MEEDIRILEDILKDKDTKFWIGKNGIQALENLIKSYRKTKEELESVKEIYYTQKDIETDYIPKSKVKELHKEYYEKSFC